MIAEQSKDSPNVISCPPLVFLTALVAGFLLNWLFQLPSFWSLPITGAIFGMAGFVLGFWGVHSMHRAGTSVRPDLPVMALVTDGPYRYTRNPLYMALTTIYVGIALSTGVLWLLVTLVPTLLVVHWKIVRREEQFLEWKFGDRYRSYKSRVRRWV